MVIPKRLSTQNGSKDWIPWRAVMVNNILSNIKTHATIIVGDEYFYNVLKQEIINSNLLCINFDYDAEDKEAKTLKMGDLVRIKSFFEK